MKSRILEYKLVSIGDIKVASSEQNARAYYTDLLEKSIDEFGFVVPVIVDQQFNLISGYNRYFVAKRIGFSQLPCIVVDLSESEASKFRLVDNKVSEKSNWDWCKLSIELDRIGDNLERYELSCNDDSEKIINMFFKERSGNQEELF